MSVRGGDDLELEVRMLPGVLGVGVTSQDGTVRIDVVVGAGRDPVDLRHEVGRMARVLLDGVALVEVHEVGRRVDEPGSAGGRPRVQLLGVTASTDGGGVDIHLAHRNRRVTVGCRPGDSMGVAAAVLGGLGELGLPVPFEPAAVHLLPDELGSGIMVLLRDRPTGALRRGVAGGQWLEEAVARAVLNALNRYLHHDAGRLVDIRGH